MLQSITEEFYLSTISDTLIFIFLSDAPVFITLWSPKTTFHLATTVALEIWALVKRGRGRVCVPNDVETTSFACLLFFLYFFATVNLSTQQSQDSRLMVTYFFICIDIFFILVIWSPLGGSRTTEHYILHSMNHKYLLFFPSSSLTFLHLNVF